MAVQREWAYALSALKGEQGRPITGSGEQAASCDRESALNEANAKKTCKRKPKRKGCCQSYRGTSRIIARGLLLPPLNLDQAREAMFSHRYESSCSVVGGRLH